MTEQPPEMPTLADLVESHYEGLYRFAMRLSGSAADAEDLTQQAFLTAQQKRSQVREPEHIRAWLYAIVRNTFLKQVRRQSTANPRPLESVAEPVTEVVDSLISSEDLQLVLMELAEEFRVPLILFYFRELSYREIAEQMELPIGTVMSRLSRAREHLRQGLQVLIGAGLQDDAD